MATSMQPERTEDLLVGILAVMALRKRDTLRTSDKVLHQAFGAALKVFKNTGGDFCDVAESYYPDVVTETYDELNNALIAAESFNLLRFPNPTYSRLQITMTPRVAEQLLAPYGEDRQVFEKAADALLEKIRG